MTAKPRIRGDNERRFWSYVSVPDHDEPTCWEWMGYRIKGGYGRLHFIDGLELAHRVSWFLNYGKWPDPEALHHCDNPPCIRISHLFEGDQRDNVQDMISKGRANYRLGNRTVAKLTVEQVQEIRIRYAAQSPPIAQGVLGREYGVTQGAIWGIVNRKTWKSVP